MILYHASYKKFNVDQVLLANNITPYFQEKLDQGAAWVDIELNRYKPKEAPLREYSLFACDSIGNASAFIENKIGVGNSPIYYRVEMNNPVKAVMCLTDLLFKAGQSHTDIEAFANEYWHPTEDWNYFEYLSSEMKIIEILPKPDLLQRASGRNNYMKDYELRKGLYGI